MFDRSSTVVGLDIGTSKICAAVGEMTEGGALSIVGLGQAKSRGVRKGEIVDFNLAQEDIRNAIVEAEQMADTEIRSVYLGVTGGHVRGFNNRGFHPVASDDREISEEDVEDAIKNAKTINLPADHRIIHVVRQHFLVDSQEGILNPVGMSGRASKSTCMWSTGCSAGCKIRFVRSRRCNSRSKTSSSMESLRPCRC
jgi:cell division protein FtsA